MSKQKRLALIVEGKMEENGLFFLINKIASENNFHIQITKKVARIQNGHTIPLEKIVRDMIKISIFLFLRQKAELICCVFDHERRSETWKMCYSTCKSLLGEYSKQISIGIASRSIEAWLLADLNSCASVVTPSKPIPTSNKYPSVEKYINPEKELKKYWSAYSKTNHGVKFLSAIDPATVSCNSSSFTKFTKDLIRLDLEHKTGFVVV